MNVRITRLAPAFTALLALAACGSTTSAPSTGTTPSVTTPTAASSTPTPAAPASWRIVSSPNFAAKGDNGFNGVACMSVSDCWAVGLTDADDTTGSKTLAAHWDGAAWKLANAPDATEKGGDMLADVTCVTSADCWAVGGGNGYGTATLVEHWNGSTWRISPSANTSEGGALNGVACASSDDCWAVGNYAASGVPVGSTAGTLTEHWNGSSWRIVATPHSVETSATNGAVNVDSLARVTCVSSSDCWAVGAIDTGNGMHALIENWNGSSWTVSSAPNPNPYDNSLAAVSCTAADSCWAVGGGGQGNDKTDFYHWNGTKWTVTTDGSSPNTTVPDAITCISANDCWMVGSVDVTPSSAVVLAERWDGTSWKRAQIPSPPMPNVATTMQRPASPVLDAIACVAPNECVAVGSHAGGTSSGSVTLVEEFSNKS